MKEFFTEHLSLIIWIVVVAIFAAVFLLTEEVEVSKTVRSNSDLITDQERARKELKYRSEADNKAEIEYINKYMKAKAKDKNETIF